MAAAALQAASLPERLNGHVQGLLFQVRDSIRAHRESCDREAVRQLRLAIKRLRLFYMLREQGVGSLSRLPDAALFDKLFCRAGRLRDLHVQLGLIDTWKEIGHNRLDEMVNELKRQEWKKRTGLLRVYRYVDEPFLAKTASQLASACLALDEMKLLEGINGLFNLHCSSLLAFPRRGDRHLLRTLVKNTRYSIELFALCRVKQVLPARIDRHLRRIQKPLGQWHDAVVGIQQMELCLSENIQSPVSAAREYLDYKKYLRGLLRANLIEFQRHWEAFLSDIQVRAFQRLMGSASVVQFARKDPTKSGTATSALFPRTQTSRRSRIGDAH